MSNSKKNSYKTFKITKKYLQSRHACEEGLQFFNKHFPKGLVISNSQEEMDEIIAELASSVDLEFPMDLHCDVRWLIYALSPTRGVFFMPFRLTLDTAGALISESEVLK